MTERAGSGCHLKYGGQEDYRGLLKEKMSVLSRRDSVEERQCLKIRSGRDGEAQHCCRHYWKHIIRWIWWCLCWGPPQADVLLISPIYLGEKVWQEGYDQDFSSQSVKVSKELETVYERIAAERQIGYLRASDYVQCSEADQEHLNAQEHQIFAQAVYEKTERMLWKRSGWRQVV